MDRRDGADLGCELRGAFSLAPLGQGGEDLGDDEGADFIVETPGDDELVSEGREAFGVGGGIAELDELLGVFSVGEARVDPEALGLGRWRRTVAVGDEMDGAFADHAEDGASGRVDRYPSACDGAHVVAADGAEAEEAGGVDVADLEADLVDMPREHHLWAPTGVDRGDGVAVDVDAHLVGDGLHGVDPETSRRAFVA